MFGYKLKLNYLKQILKMFLGGLPDSPPDSGSERALLSPSSAISGMKTEEHFANSPDNAATFNPGGGGVSPPRMAMAAAGFPDLSVVDYSAPLQVVIKALRAINGRRKVRKTLKIAKLP